ncbi:MAG: type II CAAX endopeptidase family protein [Candidatus Tantalella remota]|nr:type II CAAX endopeptidase family protein [Candidatus Tantalella remota]
MSRFTNFIGRNKLYVVLVVFIVGMNFLAFVGGKMMDEDSSEPQVTEEAALKASEETDAETMFDEEDIEARREKFEKIAEDDPTLYLFLGLLNLLILFVIFLGVILDVYFLTCKARKRLFDITLIRSEPARWTLGDVARVTLIFLGCGYLFIILQSMVGELIPVFNNDNFQMVFNTAVMNVVGISVIFYFIVRKYGQKIEVVGLSAKKFLKGVFYGLTGYLAIIPVLILIMVVTYFVTKMFAYKPPVQPIVEIFMEEKQTAVLWFSTLFAAIFSPIAEEIFFRGFMYKAMKRKWGVFWSMLATALVFSLLHTHIVGFLPIFVLGLLLAYLYERTGSLVPSICVHIVHNVGMVILVFLVRALG